MNGSSGCLGCDTKPALMTSIHERSNGLRLQGRTVKKRSEDFWTTSAWEVDNSAIHSQGSISSISTSTQNLDPQTGSGTAHNSSEFVNHGLLLWNETRQHWVRNKRSKNQVQKVREHKLKSTD